MAEGMISFVRLRLRIMFPNFCRSFRQLEFEMGLDSDFYDSCVFDRRRTSTGVCFRPSDSRRRM